MASDRNLTAQKLAVLGADRLAELLLELAAGDAALKRQLRLELAAQAGSADVAGQIAKRLATIAKSKSRLDWSKLPALAKDLAAQRAAITKHVAPAQPAEAVNLLWRLLDLGPSLYDRCDDAPARIDDVIAGARDDLGRLLQAGAPPLADLVERVFASIYDDGHGVFDGLIALAAPALGKEGLLALQAKVEAQAKAPPPAPPPGERRVIGYSLAGPNRGPIYAGDWAASRRQRQLRTALTEIADALGDVDSYINRFTPAEQTNPYTAAQIATRLLAAGRAAEAMAAIDRAAATRAAGGYWPDWDAARIETLDALGRADEAQQARLAVFERSLNPAYLRAYLKRLPDFDDIEAENKAIAQVRARADAAAALAFLIKWPAHQAAAAHVLARWREFDGDDYELLAAAADALDARHPLAATLMLRAMISFALDKARSKRYPHAARHLQSCAHLAPRIEDWGIHPRHDDWVAALRERHAGKRAFWGDV